MPLPMMAFITLKTERPNEAPWDPCLRDSLLSNGLHSSAATASSGCWAETYQPGSAWMLPRDACMVLRDRLPSKSGSLFPFPQTSRLSGFRGGATGLALPGSRSKSRPRREVRVYRVRLNAAFAANSDDVTILRRPIFELHQSMRILWKPFGVSRRLLQVEWCHPSESILLFTLVPRLRKAPTVFLLGQRQGFSTMPDLEASLRDSELFSPPPAVRGMTELDRTAFKKTVSIPVLKVRKEVVNRLMRALRRVALQRPGIKRVIEDPEDGDSRLIMLDPYRMLTADSFDKAELGVLKELDVSPRLSQYNLELTYENFKSEEVLRAVLPEGQDVTSGFSRVGHIAHLNLRDHQLPFKHLIGQVMVDKNPGITSAVNKTSNIDNTYRNFQMEVLCGEETMLTKVRENNYTYEFDFSKVYWNPRLSTEHGRITELLNPGDVLFDVFAGVGPFAIPAARKNCTVFANDLNPESHKWLLHNCKLNKVDQKVKVFNMDGKDFLQGPVREELMLRLGLLTEAKPSVHIVMNLPAKAIEFLSVFRSLLDGPPSSPELLPTVHCYCFSKESDPAKDVCQRAEAVLGVSLEASSSVHLVRNVAPNKEMLCITFQIPAATLYSLQNDQEPPLKRQKTGDSFSGEPQITSDS